MWYGWTTSTYHSKHCIGRFVDQERTRSAEDKLGEESSRKTYVWLGLDWKDKGGIRVWPSCPYGCRLNLSQWLNCSVWTDLFVICPLQTLHPASSSHQPLQHSSLSTTHNSSEVQRTLFFTRLTNSLEHLSPKIQGLTDLSIFKWKLRTFSEHVFATPWWFSCCWSLRCKLWTDCILYYTGILSLASLFVTSTTEVMFVGFVCPSVSLFVDKFT